MEENPLLEASRKCQKLQEYTEKLANAAHQHPEVAYDRGSTPKIGYKFGHEELNEEEALADMKLFSYLVSNKWQETQDYFIFDLENELELYVNENDNIDGDLYREAFEQLYQECRKLDRDLKKIDHALEPMLDKTPSQKFEGATLEPTQNTLARSD